MLLPLPKPRLLRLDLLREALTQRLFLLLELGVIKLLHLRLAELARLHLLLAVVLVVQLLRRADQIEHVRADEERAQFAEVAVVFVLDCGRENGLGGGEEEANRREERTFGDTPEVLASLDDAAVGRLDVLGTADDRERHRISEDACVLGGSLVLRISRGLVDTDTLHFDNLTNLQ